MVIVFIKAQHCHIFPKFSLKHSSTFVVETVRNMVIDFLCGIANISRQKFKTKSIRVKKAVYRNTLTSKNNTIFSYTYIYKFRCCLNLILRTFLNFRQNFSLNTLIKYIPIKKGICYKWGCPLCISIMISKKYFLHTSHKIS